MIIWLPEKMHTSAANMLLKLIEEPPENTIFLLVSEDPDQLLLTISSRAQAIKLEAIPDEVLKERVMSKNGLTASQAADIVRLSNGNYIRTLEIIETSAENELNFESFTSIMRLCWKRDYFGVNDWVEDMSQLGRERLKSFFEYSMRMVRENLMTNLKKPELVYLTDKEGGFSKNFHRFINGNNVVQLYEELNKASVDIERNGYSRIVLFDLALHIIKLIRK